VGVDGHLRGTPVVLIHGLLRLGRHQRPIREREVLTHGLCRPFRSMSTPHCVDRTFHKHSNETQGLHRGLPAAVAPAW